MTVLISIMSFANFVFWPLVIGTIIAVLIEQFVRRFGNEEVYDDRVMIGRAMAVRKYLYRQAWIFNAIWLVSYIILGFVLRSGQQAMPDMVWQG